jgi:hypothetical protein
MSRSAASGDAPSASLRFFEGFAWAVPTAFAGALAAYRFEQGDVLHRSREAYDSGGAPPPAAHPAMALQILAPPRSARGAGPEAEGDRRRASFESEVTLSVVDLVTGQRRERVTTQGRLLMTLWRGEIGWIEGEGEAPPVPFGARELAGRLEALRPAFLAALEAEAAVGPAGSLFLFVVDLASDASRVKAEAIREALAWVEGIASLDLDPGRLGVEGAERFHPALVVRGIALPRAGSEAVTRALRGALYGGGRPAGEASEAEEGSDRFSVARHGLLTPLAP